MAYAKGKCCQDPGQGRDETLEVWSAQSGCSLVGEAPVGTEVFMMSRWQLSKEDERYFLGETNAQSKEEEEQAERRAASPLGMVRGPCTPLNSAAAASAISLFLPNAVGTSPPIYPPVRSLSLIHI